MEWLASNIQWIFSGIGVVVLIALGNFILKQIRSRRSSPETESSAQGMPPSTPVHGADIEVLPLSFTAYIHQDIPHIEVWLYVVNHSSRQARVDSLQIPHFNFTGGPSVDSIGISGQLTIPAKHSSLTVLRRALADSEARAILRAQPKNPANASYRVLARFTVGRKHITLDMPHVSSNGIIGDLPGR